MSEAAQQHVPSGAADAGAEIDLSQAPLLTHLIELRRRLCYVLAFFLAAFAVSYVFAESIYGLLMQPLLRAFGEDSGRRMIYTGLHEAFFTYVKLALFAALFVSIPMLLNQVWKFLAPGLYTREKRSLRPLLFATPVLFTTGAAVAFYGVFPLAWRFFLSFETPGGAGALPIELEARVGEYLTLVIKLVLAFGVSFELPVAVLLFAKLGLLTADTLRAYRKHAIVLTFLAAGVITPPDVISQIALGVPLLLLYEASIRLVEWSQTAEERSRAEAAARGI
ncbi:MAG: twin-arginine translocase subunit TatC [Proteobacteria bacterium]|nr:twin-arginine translocase subunit TatC [Pseudomonadota bacterium]